MKTAGLILAAGNSRRMGDDNKLLLPFKGKPILSHVLEASLDSNLNHTCVVIGYDRLNIKKLLVNKEIQIVTNQEWSLGMASSIVAGVSHLKEYDGILILMGDMPLVTPELINKIIIHGATDKIVLPVKDAQKGNPVFFGSNFMHELVTIEGDRGARKVIQSNSPCILKVEVKSDAIFRDFDTHDKLNEYGGTE